MRRLVGAETFPQLEADVSIRVLLVDDDPDFRLLLRLQLDLEQGITVVGDAPDGYAGLELRTAERPDAMIIDLMMPGIDGYELARRIRQVDEDVALICYTAVPTLATGEQLADLGVELLRKSGSSSALVAALRASASAS